MSVTTDSALALLVETIQQTKDFASEQLPLVAQETLQYGAYAASIDILVCTLVTVVSFVVAYKLYKKSLKSDFHSTDVMIVATIVGIGSLGFGCATVCRISELVKIKTAPRLFLLETLMPAPHKCRKGD